MKPVKNEIKVQRTARYFTLGGGNSTSEIVFVLHGYGMNAGSFISSFESLATDDRLVVAPEGLSRFYRKGFSGDVVASWMTREDRHSEIIDQQGFLNELYDQLVDNKLSKVYVVGFSQGTSTASRWISGNNRRFNGLVLWAGEFAPDALGNESIPAKVHCVIGTADAFITMEVFDSRCIELENRGYRVIRHIFNGGHEIPGMVLDEVWHQLISGS